MVTRSPREGGGCVLLLQQTCLLWAYNCNYRISLLWRVWLDRSHKAWQSRTQPISGLLKRDFGTLTDDTVTTCAVEHALVHAPLSPWYHLYWPEISILVMGRMSVYIKSVVKVGFESCLGKSHRAMNFVSFSWKPLLHKGFSLSYKEYLAFPALPATPALRVQCCKVTLWEDDQFRKIKPCLCE